MLHGPWLDFSALVIRPGPQAGSTEAQRGRPGNAFDRHSRIAMMAAAMAAYETRVVRLAAVLAVFAAALIAIAPAAAWPGPPRTPAPHVKGASGPPAAWLETRTRSVWLAFSGYCWKTTCADFPPPQSRTNLPIVRVRRGALVRVHFAFTPSEVHATTFAGTTLRHSALRPARTTGWRPMRAGVVSFDARGASGSASYLVRVRIG
jgi:hypothetical protein